jgi:hypothetical protein
VKMPQRCSSSSTTRTQSVRFAAHSWDASDTLMCDGTVSAGVGLSADTVPARFVLRVRPPLPPGRRDGVPVLPPPPTADPDALLPPPPGLGVPPRFFARSFSIFLRIASSFFAARRRVSCCIDGRVHAWMDAWMCLALGQPGLDLGSVPH